jgi:hypothetical protein
LRKIVVAPNESENDDDEKEQEQEHEMWGQGLHRLRTGVQVFQTERTTKKRR